VLFSDPRHEGWLTGTGEPQPPPESPQSRNFAAVLFGQGLRSLALIVLKENFELIEMAGMKTLMRRRTFLDKKEFVADS
jgi:hypothetical protein